MFCRMMRMRENFFTGFCISGVDFFLEEEYVNVC